jgi:hypothetical protein
VFSALKVALRGSGERREGEARSNMPEAWEEDEMELNPIPLKNVSPAVPKNDSKLKEFVEDLTRMGCDGLLSKPWNLGSDATLREFLFERGNQWFKTLRQDPENWTAEVWARVYGFAPRKDEGWANRKDNFYVGKFRGDHDPKDRFHPGNCQNHREQRLIEFNMPILSPKKPKRLGITMANTLFGAMSRVRPVNCGRLIRKYVEKSIPHIGRKPSFLSPYIFNLYEHYGCINKVEEDALTIAEDEVVYNLGPKLELTESGSKESSEDPIAPKPPLPDPILIPALAPVPVPETMRDATPRL